MSKASKRGKGRIDPIACEQITQQAAVRNPIPLSSFIQEMVHSGRLQANPEVD